METEFGCDVMEAESSYHVMEAESSCHVMEAESSCHVIEADIGHHVIHIMSSCHNMEVESNSEVMEVDSACPITKLESGGPLRDAGSITVATLPSTVKAAQPTESANDGTKGIPLAVTEEMVVEEQHLEEVTIAKTLSYQNNALSKWTEMEDSERKEQYQKLRDLLYRTTFYAEYLINRVNTQETPDNIACPSQSIDNEASAFKNNDSSPCNNDDASLCNNDDSSPCNNNDAFPCKNYDASPCNNNDASPCNNDDSSPCNIDHLTPLVISQHGSERNCPEKCDRPPAMLMQDSTLTYKNEPRYINGQLVPDRQPVLFDGAILRPYQISGFTWLQQLFVNGINGILADEMGLGKTAQTIALICSLIEQSVQGPFIVCAPLSTLTNWVSEFKKFATKVPVLLYHGTKTVRSKLHRKMSRNHSICEKYVSKPVVITSYEIAIQDMAKLRNIHWSYLVVDEGQRIKNSKCLLVKKLKLYTTTHRLILTGTPLQNELSELWSLLNFLLPDIFDDMDSFSVWFDASLIASNDNETIATEAQQEDILHILHQILSPFMLRRLKSDVDLRIPPKKEHLVYAPLVDIQAQYYHGFLTHSIREMTKEEQNEHNEDIELNDIELNYHGRPTRASSKSRVDYSLLLDNGNEEDDAWFEGVVDYHKQVNQSSTESTSSPQVKLFERNFSLRNVLMHLRKTTNHPYLIEYPLTESGGYKVDEDIVLSSGKMIILDKMLKVLKTEKRQVLIFSQMTNMLDILEDYCCYRDYQFCRLDGQTKLLERQEQIDRFNRNEAFVFLLSTKAGGLGINLTAADTVIIYDSDWNPQNYVQAQDRCHRIGQTQPVMVYRFVTSDTIDETIVAKAMGKRKLEKMIIQDGKFITSLWSKNSQYKMTTSKDDLLSLLHQIENALGVTESRSKAPITTRDLHRLLDRSELYEEWAKNQNQSEQAVPESRHPLRDSGCVISSRDKPLKQCKVAFKSENLHVHSSTPSITIKAENNQTTSLQDRQTETSTEQTRKLISTHANSASIISSLVDTPSLENTPSLIHTDKPYYPADFNCDSTVKCNKQLNPHVTENLSDAKPHQDSLYSKNLNNFSMSSNLCQVSEADSVSLPDIPNCKMLEHSQLVSNINAPINFDLLQHGVCNTDTGSSSSSTYIDFNDSLAQQIVITNMSDNSVKGLKTSTAEMNTVKIVYAHTEDGSEYHSVNEKNSQDDVKETCLITESNDHGDGNMSAKDCSKKKLQGVCVKTNICDKLPDTNVEPQKTKQVICARRSKRNPSAFQSSVSPNKENETIMTISYEAERKDAPAKVRSSKKCKRVSIEVDEDWSWLETPERQLRQRKEARL